LEDRFNNYWKIGGKGFDLVGNSHIRVELIAVVDHAAWSLFP